MNDLSPLEAGLPLVEFDGPETADWGLAPAQASLDAIENNFWWMRQRRKADERERLLGDMSQFLYSDPGDYLRRAEEGWLASRSTAWPGDAPAGASTSQAVPDPVGAEIAGMFEKLNGLRAVLPGEAANLPASLEELETRADALARAAVDAERDEALNAIGNRSDPTLAGGLASFVGSMAVGVSDAEGLALLPWGLGVGSLARTVLMESFLGGAGAAMQVPGMRRQAEWLGYEAPDPVTHILTGMAFGAALPIAGRALRLGANTLTPAGRVANRDLLGLARRPEASATERGAGAVLGREEATFDTAPEGVAPEEHAARVDAAEAAMQDDAPQMVRAADVIPEDPAAAAAAPAGTAGGEPPRFDYGPGGNAAPDANQVGYVFGRLVERGASPKDAAALVGNLMQESGRGLNTGAIGDGGNSIGIGQWNGPRRRALMRLAEARGVDWRDLDLQIEFLWRELHGSERAAWDAIRAAPDAAAAARVASERFWRPGVPHLSNRMAFARMVADQYARGEVPKGGSPGRWRDPGDDAMAAGVYSFDPADLQVDAASYQFKMGGDEFGVNARLQGEREWDASAAIGVIVHERLDGSRYIADGHQRMGLARRLMERGHEPITLQGFLLREIDGVGVEDARALAALRNIRQESGSPLDAARIMRDRPDLVAQLGSRSRPFMAQATGLADLAPGPFQAVVNEVIPQNFGAIVGRVIPDDDRMQGVAIATLAKAKAKNEVEAESVVQDVRRLGLERAADAAQMEFFADGFDLRQTVIPERARLIDHVIREARADRAIFLKLEREADTIEEAGNVLDRDANLSRAEEAERTLARLLILADQPGPVRDAIDEAARALKGGARLADAARIITDALGAPRPAARGGTAADGPPGGGDAPAPLTVRLSNVEPRQYVRSIAEDQPFDDLDGGYARAEIAQTRLVPEGERIAGEVEGATFKNPGLKERETAEEKLGRKGYATPRRLTDLSRGGFTVRTTEQADALVERLGQVFEVIDEGWRRNEVAYIDRKVIVRHPDGMLSEIQIWTEPMFAAKKLGTPLYDQRRALPDDHPDRLMLEAREREIYSAAAEGLGHIRFSADGTSSEPRVFGNALRRASSDGRTAPLTDTSSASTGVQPGRPSMRDSAKSEPLGLRKSTVGRPSQSQYDSSFMGDVPFPDNPSMGAARPSVNDLPAVGEARIEPGLFDDPVEDAAETARLAGLDRDFTARLADPAFDLALPDGGRGADGEALSASLRDTLADLDEEADFADALRTICNLKGD